MRRPGTPKRARDRSKRTPRWLQKGPEAPPGGFQHTSAAPTRLQGGSKRATRRALESLAPEEDCKTALHGCWTRLNYE